jgi:hypothetical protein
VAPVRSGARAVRAGDLFVAVGGAEQVGGEAAIVSR